MSEEDIKVDETTEDENLETNDETEQDEDLDGLDSSEDEFDDESDEDDSDDEGGEEELDYQAELEEAQGRLAKQNERIAKQDKKIIKLKKQKKTDEFGDEIEEEEEDDIDAKLDAKLKSNMASLREDVIDDAIEAITSNDNEAKLIRFHFDNSLNVKGFSKKEIIENVSFAKAIANKGKTDIKNKMISKKIKSAKTAGAKSTTGIPPKKAMKVTAQDKKMADKFFNGDIKRWMKNKDN